MSPHAKIARGPIRTARGRWRDGGVGTNGRRRLGARRSPHRGEVDCESADVTALRVANDQGQPRLRRDLLDGKSVDAPREVCPALGAKRGPLVLDEGRLDLAIAQDDPRRVEPREILARPAEI